MTTLSPEDARRVRAVEIWQAERLRSHEAGHCASALLLNLPVSSVSAPFHGLDDLLAEHDDDAAAGSVIIGADLDDPDELRKYALCLLAGRLEEGPGLDDSVWPPIWPLLTVEPEASDEAKLVECVKALGLDRSGYAKLVADARDLTATPAFERLAGAVAYLLEQHPHLDGPTLLRVKAVSEGKHVEHVTKAATVTPTEQGQFVALAATYSVDRVKDQIVPGAFAGTIERWQASGKRVPLHWNHEGAPSSIIGAIDPHTMRETDAGLRVAGELDITNSETAREAWRAMKTGSMSLSFGYVTTKSRKRGDVNELLELDLFEISIVAHPANADTRIIEMKNADGDDLAAIRAEWRAVLLHAMSLDGEAKRLGRDELRAKADRVARLHALDNPAAQKRKAERIAVEHDLDTIVSTGRGRRRR